MGRRNSFCWLLLLLLLLLLFTLSRKNLNGGLIVSKSFENLRIQYVFHSLQSVCESSKLNPCGEKGICIPDYSRDSFRCKCDTDYEGIPCGKCRKKNADSLLRFYKYCPSRDYLQRRRRQNLLRVKTGQNRLNKQKCVFLVYQCKAIILFFHKCKCCQM